MTLEGVSDEDISIALDIKLSKVPKLRGIGKEESLSGVIGNGSDGSELLLEDIVASEDCSIKEYYGVDSLSAVEAMLENVDCLERQIFCHYNDIFGYEKLTYSALSEKYNRSMIFITSREREVRSYLRKAFSNE